jgi:hypothetical protein
MCILLKWLWKLLLYIGLIMLTTFESTVMYMIFGLNKIPIQYDTMQYNTIQCNTTQYNTMQHNTKTKHLKSLSHFLVFMPEPINVK